jgi:hypothetical protein
VLGECAGHRLHLELPEVRFPVLDEQVGDAHAREVLDVGVGVPETDPEQLGDGGADGRLARGGGPDQDQERSGHRICSESR